MKTIRTCLLGVLLIFGSLCMPITHAQMEPIGKPVLLSPAPGSTLSACAFHGLVDVVANANHAQARQMELRVFLNDPRTLLKQAHIAWETEAEAWQNHVYEGVFLGAEPPNLHYLIELRTEDADGHLIAFQYFTLFTQSLDSAIPVFVHPTDGQQTVSRQPLIRIEPFPARTCGALEGVSYEIDTYPADWQGYDYQYTHFTLPVYSWRVPQLLQPAIMYEVRVSFLADEHGSVGGRISKTIRFTTGTSVPRFGDPILMYPDTYPPLPYVCGRLIGVRVIPNHSDTYTVGVRLLLNDPRTFLAGAGGRTTSEEALDTLALVLSNATRTSPDHPTQHLLEVTTLNQAGEVLGQSYVTIFMPARGSSFPVIPYPANEQTNVPLSPTVQVQPFPDNACGTLEKIRYSLFSSDDSQMAELGPDGYTWAPPQPLLPLTVYTLRVEFYGTGITPIGVSTSTTVTFTTTAAAPGRLAGGVLEGASGVFPHPVTEQSVVRLRPSAAFLTIRLFAADGRLVWHKRLPGGSLYPLPRSLSQGLYLLHVTDDYGHTEQLRLVK